MAIKTVCGIGRKATASNVWRLCGYLLVAHAVLAQIPPAVLKPYPRLDVWVTNGLIIWAAIEKTVGPAVYRIWAGTRPRPGRRTVTTNH